MQGYIGYIRVSTTKQGEGVSLEVQKEAIAGYAERKNRDEAPGNCRVVRRFRTGDAFDGAFPKPLGTSGYPLFYGAMGENLTTRGIDVRQIRIGDEFRVGGALLEITQPRGPCSALDVYGESLKLEVYDRKVKERDYTSARWGMSGFYASVATPGPVRAGDAISLVSKLA